MLALLNRILHGAEANRAYFYRLATVLGPVLVGAHFITSGVLSTVLTVAGAILGVGGTGLAAANTSTKKG
jgi:hypothetical protein